ncbi:MAG: ATP-dependent zinc metalloprotease FtsH [Saprospiraceae bacterium]|uniref:ATP-dependent zinc metalloprotease FtsH n=1 Tax=Candidatus Defluviibacterium haderslevense TaxID=2981993 RepID=A0A9D7XG33_9BACT|nr:ATP-dependent zinc metalloprotease FtsH [Candidatus Defluviibacterium haderslevense]MBL0238832.1 ATP-dependent zinc metalloprotease FtsH [Candidatus Defluviibacterium haderslevense]
MENQENNPLPKKKDNGNKGFNSYWIYGILFLAIIGVNLFYIANPTKDPVSFSRFEDMALKGDLDKVEITNKKYAYIYLKKEALTKDEYKDAGKSSLGVKPHYFFNIGPEENFANKIDKLNERLPNKIELSYIEKQNWLGPILSFVLPFLLILGIWMLIMRKVGGGGSGPGGQIFNIGKSKAMLFEKNSMTNTTFEDVAGLDEAKEEVMEVVDFLKNPKKYTSLGGKIPKGVLLVGPPGTGKTLLAKAVAGEAGVPFFTISGSDFVEMFVGVGASRVRDLFRQAREKAPCIVFIDEIDAVGRARGKNQMQGGNDERENTLNQLLVEMDGFSTDNGVILMAATNRPDILDSALLRPGRFDRQISIDPPDLKGRAEIFKVHLKKLKLSAEVTPGVLAEMTPGFAGADIANVCNESALVAARRNKKEIDLDDFNFALDRVIGGLEKKNKLISPDEKQVIAFHEAGHAICGWYLPYASPLVKVTIVPRGIGTLGYAQYLPKEEYITRTEAMLDRICMTMGGRAAERIIFDKISTGAQSDLDTVTKMGYSMISVFGMNEKVGNVSFYSMAQENFQRPYSEETAKLMDEEVRKLIDIQYIRAQNLLVEKRPELDILAAELLKKEVLLRSDVERLIGPSPYHKDKSAEPVPLTGQHVSDEKTNIESIEKEA